MKYYIVGLSAVQRVETIFSRRGGLMFAAEEDFGVLPVEAQVCGTPVFAYRNGGVLESVIENKTGFFFNKQTEDSIIEAVKRFETNQSFFNYNEIIGSVARFSTVRFKLEFSSFVKQKTDS